MSGLVVFIILAIVIIGVVVGKKSYDNTKRLAEEGKISPRKGAFYENKEIFETAASYEQIRQKVKETNLEDTKANVQYDFEGGNAIFFQFSDAWNAILEQCGERNGKNLFQFYFPAWKTSRNGIVNAMSMNVLITAIEKIILSIDSATTVENHKMQIKTKSKFF